MEVRLLRAASDLGAWVCNPVFRGAQGSDYREAVSLSGLQDDLHVTARGLCAPALDAVAHDLRSFVLQGTHGAVVPGFSGNETPDALLVSGVSPEPGGIFRRLLHDGSRRGVFRAS